MEESQLLQLAFSWSKKDRDILHEGIKKLVAEAELTGLLTPLTPLTRFIVPLLDEDRFDVRNRETLNLLFKKVQPKVLHLRGAHLGTRGCEMLVGLELEELDVGWNMKVAPYVAGLIRDMPSLKRLNVDGIKFSGVEMGDIMAALRDSNVEKVSMQMTRVNGGGVLCEMSEGIEFKF
jgi:hypothetical protein